MPRSSVEYTTPVTSFVLSRLRVAAVVCAAGLLLAPTRASTPPLRRYTTADGLPTNSVTALLLDSRGFLWVGTTDGLARFDGDRFEVFDESHGLPSARITALTESAGHTLFVGTSRGIAELAGDAAAGGTPFETRAGDLAVSSLAPGPGESVLAATDRGVFEWTPQNAAPEWRPLSAIGPCSFARADRHGNIWADCADTLLRVAPGARVATWALHGELRAPAGMWILDVAEDRGGRFWIAGSGFLWRLPRPPEPGAPITPEKFEGCLQSVTPRVFSLLERRDGSLWAGTSAGPVRILDDAPPGACPFDALYPDGFRDMRIASALAEDPAGNLWASEGAFGLLRLAADGLTSFDRSDGRLYPSVESFAEAPGGELVALGAGQLLYLFEGGRFIPLTPWFPPDTAVGWGTQQRMLFDHTGALWLGTRTGLMRWDVAGDPRKISGRAPDRVYTGRDGLAADAIMRVFEDSRGDLWIAPDSGPHPSLCRWTRARDAIGCFGPEEGVPGPGSLVRSMVEDVAGDVWIGYREGAPLVRYRRGVFERFDESVGFRADEVTSLRADDRGRIWAAAPRRGLYRVDDAAGARPGFTLLDESSGLQSLDLTSLTTDGDGRVYLGSSRGIDRVDPASGSVHSYTAREGLVSTTVAAATRLKSGALWFGTAGGACSLVPRANPPPAPPRVYLMAVRVAGEPRPVSPRGAATADELSLEPTQRDLEITYTGTGRSPGERLRFQTLLEGAGGSWGEPTDRRSIAYAQLAHGRYRFAVRAVAADGSVSDPPAGFAFVIAPPVWQRWWFIALSVALVAGIAALFHRQRTARALALQQQRTRIALDLHDDVGSSLSQIALQSELALSRLERGEGDPGEALEKISGDTRELVDSMSDVVWSVNPGNDSLRDLVRRIRAFSLAREPGEGVVIGLSLPGDGVDLRLPPDLRRQAWLIFKEGLTNALRHADARRIGVTLSVEGDGLVLAVEDDGRGIAPGGNPMGGHGLVSMRERAAACGGSLEIGPGAGGGTRVLARLPLRGA